MKHLLTFALVASSLAVAAPAFAHIELVSPRPRYDDQKYGPCGRGSTDKRGTKVSTYKPGTTIKVTWKETVGHPGHYRISFDPNGQSFTDPKSYDDRNTSPTVVMDGIKDETGYKTYTQEITLPDVECDKCTLQVVQVMTDKPPYGDGDDLYYQCADITLSKDAPDPEGEEPPAEEPAPTTTPANAKAEDSSCASSPSRSAPTVEALFALSAIVALIRRRRSP